MQESQSHLPGDDGTDNLPDNHVACIPEKFVSIEELRRHSVQACEFCEEKFENRYDISIHNTKHIIIPLIKILPHFCPECVEYYVSEKDLQEHKLSEHNVENETKLLDNIAHEADDDVIQHNRLDVKVKNELKGVEDSYGTEKILQNFVMNCKVDVEKFEAPWLYISDIKEEYGEKSVSKRPKVKLEPSSGKPGSNGCTRILLRSVKRENFVEERMLYDSIHFDNLVKPGIFYCKHCYMRFPNRYDVIVHELVHLKLSNILMDTKKMLCKTKPPAAPPPHKTPSSSSQNLKMALRDEEKLSRQHKPVEEKLKHMYICASCYENNLRLAFDEEEWTQFLRMKCCGLCGRAADAVWVVRGAGRRGGLRGLAGRFRFEGEEGAEGARERGRGRALGNRERLQRIRNRLKLLKKYR